MKVLFFDTETSGLPHDECRNTLSLVNRHLWPKIVQYSSITLDTETGSVESMSDYIVKVDDSLVLDGQSAEIHGITNLISKTQGVPIEKVLETFTQECENADLIVAHNLDFDKNMLLKEWYDLISCDDMTKVHKFTNPYIKFKKTISKKEYVKWPTLEELHTHLFNEDLSGVNLHNALVDTMICARCWYNIEYNKDLRNECFAMQEILGYKDIKSH
jgi:DNA polymerase III epsilon subunit-like protein